MTELDSVSILCLPVPTATALHVLGDQTRLAGNHGPMPKRDSEFQGGAQPGTSQCNASVKIGEENENGREGTTDNPKRNGLGFC